MVIDIERKTLDRAPEEKWDDEPGHYFRTSRWWWRPLTNYISQIDPTIASQCTRWWSIEGEGLNEEQALALAKRLREEHISGRLAQYARDYDQRLNSLPLQDCTVCEGTRNSIPSPQSGPSDQQCTACQGSGKTKNRECNYHFSEENVMNFANFLEHCQGFEFY